jgi:uncharacterized membrane protein
MQRTAVWWFCALVLATIPAFWVTYFNAPAFGADFLHVHLHGIAMFAWMALLISQATLIRLGRRPLHRAMGKVSYALVPAIVASTLLLAHYRLRQGTPNDELLYFFCVQLGLLAAFVFSYAMAMRHRHVPAMHMRYMMGTALAVVDPILARILAVYFDVNPPHLQVITYGLVLGILAALWLRARRASIGRPYAAMLAVFGVVLMPTFFLPQTAAWRSFAEAFARLPLP